MLVSKGMEITLKGNNRSGGLWKMMPDREKVIKEFEEICGYTMRPHEFRVLNDVLTLLKEQEAENGEWITIWREDDPDTSTHARCSICNRISERPLGGHCKWCGAKMNQEWGVDG